MSNDFRRQHRWWYWPVGILFVIGAFLLLGKEHGVVGFIKAANTYMTKPVVRIVPVNTEQMPVQAQATASLFKGRTPGADETEWLKDLEARRAATQPSVTPGADEMEWFQSARPYNDVVSLGQQDDWVVLYPNEGSKTVFCTSEGKKNGDVCIAPCGRIEVGGPILVVWQKNEVTLAVTFQPRNATSTITIEVTRHVYKGEELVEVRFQPSKQLDKNKLREQIEDALSRIRMNTDQLSGKGEGQ